MAARSSTGFINALLTGTAFADIFFNGCIEVYSGSQPYSADAAVTGVLLARVTRDGGPWVAGSPGNGLRFDVNGRFVTKRFDHRWVLKGLDTGVAGWYRLRGNATDAGGTSLLLPRLDGSVGLPEDEDETANQLLLSDLNITPATEREMPYYYYTIPSGETS